MSRDIIAMSVNVDMIFDNYIMVHGGHVVGMEKLTMAETTNIDITVKGVKITKTVSVKPDGDSKESKKVSVTFHFNDISLRSIFDDAVRADAIRFQRTLRTQFDGLIDGQTIDRIYGAKALPTITPEMAEAAYVTKLSNMTPEEQVAELAKLSEKAKAIINS